MIIEFFVENFRSIKTRQAINLTKMNGDEVAENSFDLTEPLNLSLLRSAAFYGANASGKSNLISALQTMRKIVMTSAKDTQRGESLPVVPFKLSKETSEAPTEFEIVFVENNIKYQYGFSLTQDKIQEEWLFAFPKGRPQRWFIRAFNEKRKSICLGFLILFPRPETVMERCNQTQFAFLINGCTIEQRTIKTCF
ncbi:AAA family ATPase [Aeromonas veronii]|uniref:AAA family ATPase n=1 Tax=Aeromonas veronii TaxID=654 RepID=UPI002442589F|nr:AAA family ATPase [Aeromonas veronii]